MQPIGFGPNFTPPPRWTHRIIAPEPENKNLRCVQRATSMPGSVSFDLSRHCGSIALKPPFRGKISRYGGPGEIDVGKDFPILARNSEFPGTHPSTRRRLPTYSMPPDHRQTGQKSKHPIFHTHRDILLKITSLVGLPVRMAAQLDHRS